MPVTHAQKTTRNLCKSSCTGIWQEHFDVSSYFSSVSCTIEMAKNRITSFFLNKVY